jgi:hypothetical protein
MLPTGSTKTFIASFRGVCTFYRVLDPFGLDTGLHLRIGDNGVVSMHIDDEFSGLVDDALAALHALGPVS